MAAALVEEQARKTAQLARVGELDELAWQLRAVSPISFGMVWATGSGGRVWIWT